MAYTIPKEEAQESTEEQNIRLYREGDIPAIVTLINAAYEADGFGTPTTVEQLTSSYGQPLSDPLSQVMVAESASGELLAMSRAICFDDPNANERLYQMRLLVHPRARADGLEYALASRMMENIRDNEKQPEMKPRDKVWLIAIVREEDSRGRALLEKIGLRDIRHAWTMQRSLNLAVAEPKAVTGIRFRNYQKPNDNPALLEAYNNSFIDHFEFHALTQEMVDYQVGRPIMRADLSWVGDIESEPGKLAGFCLCEINEPENERTGNKEGWIELLGTIRGWRGVGLGKSLLLRGLQSLKEAGMDTALLGVDSESPTGANRLYESVGFAVRHHDIMYTGELAQATI